MAPPHLLVKHFGDGTLGPGSHRRLEALPEPQQEQEQLKLVSDEVVARATPTLKRLRASTRCRARMAERRCQGRQLALSGE